MPTSGISAKRQALASIAAGISGFTAGDCVLGVRPIAAATDWRAARYVSSTTKPFVLVLPIDGADVDYSGKVSYSIPVTVWFGFAATAAAALTDIDALLEDLLSAYAGAGYVTSASVLGSEIDATEDIGIIRYDLSVAVTDCI